MKSILVKPGMLKQLLSSKSPIPVRSACCALIALLCKRWAPRPSDHSLILVLLPRCKRASIAYLL